MLTYEKLKQKPREFLSATGMTQAEFEIVLPSFATAYDKLYPKNLTFDGRVRARAGGAGVKGVLSKPEDKLLFSLVYQKTRSYLKNVQMCRYLLKPYIWT